MHHNGGKDFMIRLRIPSGSNSFQRIKVNIWILLKNMILGGIHFTTRQAIQLHGLTLDGACDLMKEALRVNNIYTEELEVTFQEM